MDFQNFVTVISTKDRKVIMARLNKLSLKRLNWALYIFKNYVLIVIMSEKFNEHKINRQYISASI